jgi:hypothetical protein
MQEGTVSIINIFPNLNHHPKSILSDLKFAKGLPFQNVLSKETIAKSMQDLEYHERFFTPEPFGITKTAKHLVFMHVIFGLL